MANYTLKLGSYTFPSTFHPSAVPGNSRVAAEQTPRRDGMAAGEQYAAEKIIGLRGMLRADTPEALRTAMDSLLSTMNDGRQKLYLWDDRYIWATKTGLTTDYDETSFKRYCWVALEFLCDSPFWESETQSSDTWGSPVSGNTHDVSTGGNAYARPTFELTVSGAGDLDVTLALGGESFSLTGSVADGEVLLIDCAEETVTRQSDGADRMTLFDGAFLSLQPNGMNTLTYTRNSGTPVVSSVVTRWRNRWY